MMRRFFLFLCFLCFFITEALPVIAEVPSPVTFEVSRLIISGADGRDHSFTVELALSAPQRARGLMFRDRLARDAGMLFLWEDEAPRRMWMKNTMVPLDMIFFDKEGRIIHIEHTATPYTEQTISSGGAAQGVLELAGGTSRLLGIVAGDWVVHPLLPPLAR